MNLEAIYRRRVLSESAINSFQFEVVVGNETITLPFDSSYSYNCLIDWGDTTSSNSTAWNVGNSHTYTAGTYIISISGVCEAFLVSNGAIKNKIREIIKWGLPFKRLNFWGCSNLTATTVSDVLDTSQLTVLSNIFRGCTSIAGINRINEWDVSGIRSFQAMFHSSFAGGNQTLSNWSTDSALNMLGMFLDAHFDSDISSWDTSLVWNMNSMFVRSSFNRDISAWDYSSLTDINSFMNGKSGANYSVANYNALLTRWASNAPNGLTVDMGTINYSAPASAARTTLTTTKGWSITDGGII